MIAPLRERPEDVVFLARRFAADAADELGRRFSGLSREAEGYLVGQPWPGNVRQLRNEVRRAVLLSPGDLLSLDAFRLARRRAGEGPAPATPQDAELPRVTLAELERRAFEQALRETGQTWAKAAQLLGLDYSTFRRRLRRHGLDPDARHGG